MRERTYGVGRSSITLRFGDIIESRAEVLVSSDDYMLSMSGGVSAALRKAGGPQVAADAQKLVPARLGEVVVSSAGILPARYLFHAVTIGAMPAEMDPAAVVRQVCRRAMALLPALGCSSIAFPAIGAGTAGISQEIVAAEMAASLVEPLLGESREYRVEVHLLDRSGTISEDDFFVFFEHFAARKLGVVATVTGGGPVLLAPTDARPEMDPEQASSAHRRNEISTMMRHLDTQRARVESELIKVLQADRLTDPSVLAAWQDQLEQINSLRRIYEGQLIPKVKEISTMLRHLDTRRARVESELIKVLQADGLTDPSVLVALQAQLEQINSLRRTYEGQLMPRVGLPAGAAPRSVFVSSTSADLAPHRQAVRDVIKDLRMSFVGMEDFDPTATPPADLIRQKVLDSERYVGVLGMRYGYVDPGTGLSMTEIEYRQAIAAGKPMHLFVMAEGATITAGMVETDSVRFARLLEFKSRVLKDHTCKLFTTPADLAEKVQQTLRQASAA